MTRRRTNNDQRALPFEDLPEWIQRTTEHQRRRRNHTGGHKPNARPTKRRDPYKRRPKISVEQWRDAWSLV